LYLELNAIDNKAGECAIVESIFSQQATTKCYGKWYVYPWQNVYIYDVTVKNSTLELRVLNYENIETRIKLSAYFNPNQAELEQIHKKFGMNYNSNVVNPILIESTELKAKDYSSLEIWASKRDSFEISLTEAITNELATNHILLNDLIVISIDLPVDIEQQLITKLELEQDSLRRLN
jgi:hypothetical protein